jgi:CRP-like cAMP-binding protein
MAVEDLEIEKDKEGEALEDFYGEAGPGNYFGELAILKGDAKPMSAFCVRNTHLLVVPRKTIEFIQRLRQ